MSRLHSRAPSGRRHSFRRAVVGVGRRGKGHPPGRRVMRWRAQRRVPIFARSPRGARLGLRPYGVAVVATLLATGLTADTGAGIPADLLPRIFEPGMRHAGSEGFGLGLTIAKD